MIALVKRYFARKRLRPVVGVLPRALSTGFGTRESYTFAQASQVADRLRLPPHVLPYAYAVACSAEELVANGSGITAEERQRLRAELAHLFGLVGPHFTLRQLLRTRISQHEPARDSTDGNIPHQGGSRYSSQDGD